MTLPPSATAGDEARSEGIAARLATLTLEVARTDLPADTLAATSRLVRHAIGVCVAGQQLEVARLVRAAIGRAPGACTIFGAAARQSAQDAAFANAAIAHATLLEDSGPGGKREGSHPSVYVFPAALALAEETDASGADLLRAVAAAYETVSRLGALMPGSAFERGFRVVPVLGPFGAAAAAGVLLEASPSQLAASFGIAANLAGGFNQGFVDGTMEPYLHPAFAACNGILAARLSLAGCTASAASLEGERGFFATFCGEPAADIDWHLDTSDLAVRRVGTKRFASCLYNQGTLALLREHFPGGLHVADVVKVILHRPASGSNGLHAPGVAALPPFASALARQMSARFTAAAALAGRPVDDPAWFERAHDDVEVSALALRTDLVVAEDPGVAVEIVRRDASRWKLTGPAGAGLGFSDAATAAQFAGRIRPVLGAEAALVVALTSDLAGLDRVSRLTALLRPPA